MIEHELQKNTEEHTRPACEFGRGARTIVTHYIQNFGCEKVCGTMFSARRRKRHARGVSSPERPDKMTMHFTNDSMNFHSRIGLATLLAMLLSLSARAADWPQWRGPNRDNVWNETGILRTFPNKGLKFRWRTSVGPGWTSPVVVQGRVYLTDMRLDKPKAWERILCFKESTGKLLWSREYELFYPEFCFNAEQGGGPAATLIVEAGKVYWQAEAVRWIVWTRGAAKSFGKSIWTRNTQSGY